jgi:hypothetical protein
MGSRLHLTLRFALVESLRLCRTVTARQVKRYIVTGPPTNCYGATGGRVLKLMGNSQGRDNVKKRRARRKKTERLALAKRKQKAAK